MVPTVHVVVLVQGLLSERLHATRNDEGHLRREDIMFSPIPAGHAQLYAYS